MNELLLLSPLISIGAVSIIALLIDAWSKPENKTTVYVFSIFGLLLTGALSVYTIILEPQPVFPQRETVEMTRGMVSFGGYPAFFDVIFCIAGIMTIIASRSYNAAQNYEKKEFYSMMLFSTAGMMVVGHSANLITLFLGIELMSISFYILAGYFRNSLQSVESALKYFLLGCFATGFLIYGMALIYGYTGTFYLQEINDRISSGMISAPGVYLYAGMAFLIIGLAFKLAAFPFHQWAPDVYTGAPTTIAAYLSAAGKAAALIGFIIVARSIINLETASAEVLHKAQTLRDVISVIAAATMLIGNITALVQKNIKRMLAYSSVAHAGYLLMGIVANTHRGWSGIIFYATAYIFMQIGSFIVLAIMEREQGEKNLNFDDYKGLHTVSPGLAALMSVFMFSLAGLPPFSGFYGKYLLFTASIESGYLWLAIIGVISSIISMYFYIGLIVYMYFKDKETEGITVSKAGSAKFTLAIAGVGTLLFGVYPPLLQNIIDTVL